MTFKIEIMKISIIIPAHNEENVIKRCLDSVINSKYKDFEIIIVNDGSTDRTEEIVKEYMKKFPKKIRIINHKFPRGPAVSRNKGAKFAKGDVLFFLDADEWIKEDTLENVKKAFEKFSVEAISCTRRIIFPKGFKRIWTYKFSDDWCVQKETKVSYDTMNCPYIMTREFFNKVGGFPTNSFYFEDYMLIKKIHSMKLKILTSKEIIVFSDMGGSWKDFYKRAENIGKGLAISKIKKKILIFLIQFFAIIIGIILIFLNPLIFLLFYLLFTVYWFIRVKNFVVSVAAPFLFGVEKLISFIFFLKNLFKVKKINKKE